MTVLARINGSDRPDQLATAQGVYGLLSLRGCRRSSLEGYLGSDAQLVRWYCDPATWPVDHAVARQGPHSYWAWCYGTTNIAQWSSNVIGATGVRQSDKGPLWHAGFLDAARILRDHLEEQWRVDGEPEYLAIYGHSLGGAAAQLLAYYVRVDHPNCQVEVCTFGQPAAASPGQPEVTLPHRHYRMVATEDPVPFLPGVFGGLVWVFASVAQGWLADYPAYRQYGTPVVLETYAGAFGILPELVTRDPIAAHLMPDYWGRVYAWQRRFGNSQPAVDTLKLARDLAYGRDVHAFADVIPGTATIPSGAVVTVPATLPDTAGPEVQVMAYPTNLLTGGAPLRVTLFFDWTPDIGWSETYDGYQQSPIIAESITRPWLTQLFALRRAMLSKVCTMRRARVSFPGSKIKAQLVTNRQFPGSFGTGTDTTGTGAVSLNYGVLLRFVSLDETRTSQRTLRGFRDALLAGLTSDPLGSNPWITGSNGAFSAFATFFTRVTSPLGGILPIIGAIGTTDRDQPRVTPISIAVNAAGYLALTIPNNSILFPGTPPRVPGPTDLVQVFHQRQGCIKGLSGRFGVISYTPGPDNAVLVLATRPCCSPAEIADARIQAQAVVQAYYGVSSFDAVRQATRNTGRPFVLRRGRRKACCK